MPQKPNAWINLGNQKLDLGNYGAALICFDKAITHNPESTEAWKGRRVAIHKLGNAQDIVSASSHVIAMVLYERGLEQEERKDYFEAIKSYDQALAMKPDFEEIRINRSKALRNLVNTPLFSSYVLQRSPSPEPLSSAEIEPQAAIKIKAKNLYEQGIKELNKGVDELKKRSQEQNIETALSFFRNAKSYFEEVIVIEPENANAWYANANSLHNLGHIREAITSLRHAVEITQGSTLENLKYEEEISNLKLAELPSHNNPCIYEVQSDALRKLGSYKKAIRNCSEVINHHNRISNLKSSDDLYQAYLSRGHAYRRLGIYWDALSDYEHAIKIRKDCYLAHCGRGNILKILGNYEKAIISYEEAIFLEANSVLAYNGLGNVYKDLRRYQEAISQYNKAIWLEPNNHLTYNNRGAVLRKLGLLNEAISDFNKALELSRHQNWRAWVNLGWTYFQDLAQYQEALQVWNNGLQELERLQQLQPNPEYQRGCGELYWCKGKAHYRYGRLQHKPYSFWFEAYNNYEQALKFLEFKLLSERHLEVWEDLIKVSQYIKPEKETEELLQQATDLLRRLQAEQSSQEKIRLERKFVSFYQIGVDILATQGKEYAAIELAEARKNSCLTWMLGTEQNLWCDPNDVSDPSYDEIQHLLDTKTSAIYWHISPSALTTFILKNGHSPIVWTLEPDSKILGLEQISDMDEKNHILNEAIIPKTVERLNKFEKWMNRWKLKYEKNRKKIKDTKNNSGNNNWHEKMSSELKNLAKILQVQEITNQLEDVDELIIIAHRDLHLLPLEALFSDKFTIIRLPSAKIGLKLKENSIELKNSLSLISIEHPKTSQPLLFAEIESAMIANLYKDARLIPIEESKATKENLLQVLQSENAEILHFTGHAEHNIDSPLESALELANQERISMNELLKSLRQSYYLVCLSACETGITSKSNIIDEFVGLASAFLAKGSNYIISTLWTVDEISSALIIIEFYRLLKDGKTPPQALKLAKKWLSNITSHKLADWYKQRAKEIEDYDLGCCENLESAANNAEKEAKEKGFEYRPYGDPYYWAGFTITGKVNCNAQKQLENFQQVSSNDTKVVDFKFEYNFLYLNCSDILQELEHHQQLLADYNETIRIQPNNYQAYNGRGNVYKYLERYEEAIADYDKAISLKPDYHLAYNYRGEARNKLKLSFWELRVRAKSDFEKALELSLNQNWRAWVNLGWFHFRENSFESALQTWDKGLRELERLQEQKPYQREYRRGRGELYWCKGKANYRYACYSNCSPYKYWFKAHDNYKQALSIIKFEVLPERHLEIFQDLIEVSQYLKPAEEVKKLLNNATKLLRELKVNQPPEYKTRLERKFVSLDQIGVDIEAQLHNVNGALELAEKRKNISLPWMLECNKDLEVHIPSNEEIQELLNPNQAIIYWHLSPATLTTFIFRYEEEPLVWTFQPDAIIFLMEKISDPKEKEIILNKAVIPHSVNKLDKLHNLMKEYVFNDTKNNDGSQYTINLNERNGTNYLKELSEVLDIQEILKSLGKDISQLIICPHRDLHLLPLEALFPEEITITRLPSITIGLALKKTSVKVSNHLSVLRIEHPTSSQPLLFTEIESTIFANLYQDEQQKYFIAGNCTKEQILQALQANNENILHYAGHVNYNIDFPMNSALELGDKGKITLGELLNLPNLYYDLVFLPVCETFLNRKTKIIDEFVDLANVFLTKGTNYIISTLWIGEARSSVLIAIEFYRKLKAGASPPEALKEAKKWLRNATYIEITNWYRQRAVEVKDYNLNCFRILEMIINIEEEASKNNDDNYHPYSHPYYWAGFTITGKIPN